MVLAATNRPQDLDEAIRRRLEKRIYIPLPTAVGREALFRINLKGVEISDDVDFKKLVEITEGYSGADMSNVCRDAAMMPLRRKLAEGMDIAKMKGLEQEVTVPIAMVDLVEALKNVSKSVN